MGQPHEELREQDEEGRPVLPPPPYRPTHLTPHDLNGGGGEKKVQPGQVTVVYEYEEDDSIDEENRCGIACFKPDWLQPLRNMKVFLLVFILAGISQGMFYTIWNMTLSTIEKRFQIPSRTTGLIAAINDVSHICVVLFVAHFCGRSHRPRWLFVGLFTVGIAVLCFATPELFAPKWDIDTMVVATSNETDSFDKEMCLDQGQSESIKAQCKIDAPKEVNKNILTFALLGLAQILLGIGTTAPIVLAMPFIDDNVKTKNSPVYFALGTAGRFIGPAIGVFLGAFCLSTYIDLTKTPNIAQTDPRWMGAWYLGFLIVGTLICCTSTLYLLFPAKVPASQKVKNGKSGSTAVALNPSSKATLISSSSKGSLPPLKDPVKKETMMQQFAGLPRDLKRLFVNKVFVCRVANDCIDMLVVSGYFSFAPKYLEYHFQMSPANAGKYNGLASICAVFGGATFGGMIIKKLKLQPSHVALMICVSSFLISICYFFLMMVTCQQRNLFSQPVGPKQMLNVESNCTQSCYCAGRSFSPVCDETTGISYYSPCHAGCSQSEDRKKSGKFYGNCNCVANSTWKFLDSIDIQDGHANISLPQLSNATSLFGKRTNLTGRIVKRGFCTSSCSGFWIYVVIATCFKFVGAMPFSGNQMLSFRIVDPDLKSLSKAVRTLLASLFAFIPGPIMMGALIDSCCKLWNYSTCGQKGACLLYDLDSLRVKMHLYVAIVKTVACVMDVYVYFKVRHMKFERTPEPVPEPDPVVRGSVRDLTAHD